MRRGPDIPADPGVPPQRADVVVAGAGLTGLSLALMLAESGTRVVVIEARRIGAVTTGHTTGKLSLLQGGVFGSLRRHADDRVVRAYADAQRAGRRWLLAKLDGIAGAAEIEDAVTYAVSASGVQRLERELAALTAAGVEVERLDAAAAEQLALPFPVEAALRLPRQHRLQPMVVLAGLARAVRAAGVRIVTGCRVTGAELVEGGVHVETEQGGIAASSLALATGTPILDRGLMFAKQVPSRTFVAAYDVGSGIPLPRGMFLSLDEPARSIRVESDGTLVVGGGVHVPGREERAPAVLAELDDWTTRQWPGARRTMWWAAQDYRSVTHVPFAGVLPRGGGRIFAATGFDKWGLANAPAAAIQLAAMIGGRELPGWGVALAAHHAGAADVSETVRANAAVGAHLVADWVKAGVTTGGAERPPSEGEGRIVRRGMSPAAESTVDGVTRRVSGVCTHLGGIVTWNDAECSWDCPLHGSRFGPDGDVLEGPAVRRLEPLSD